MEAQKVFVRQDKTAVINCPHCSHTQTAKVDRESFKKHILNVKCKCGQVFKAQLESRKHFRKSTNIEAYFRNLTKEAEQEKEKEHSTTAHYGSDETKTIPNCIVKNISEKGVGFETKRKRLIDKDDLIEIVFTLDNVAETEVTQKVIVRGVFDQFIGCEFAEASKFETTLSFYLNE